MTKRHGVQSGFVSAGLVALAAALAPGAPSMPAVPDVPALAEPFVETDPRGDAAAHRVDAHAPGSPLPVIVGQGMPDLIGVSLAAWQTPTPAADPYSGSISYAPAPDLARIQITFAGHVNPPGTLGLGGQPFLPFRWGISPVYGFIEIDVDTDFDTGGETGAAAESRYLGVAGRFGGRVGTARQSRQALTSQDIDRNFYSAPYYERSGADWLVAFCGCFETTRLVERVGNGDQTFDPGEQWIVRGRFLRRAGGYQLASIMTGGSGVGLYDPWCEALFVSDPGGPGPSDDRTEVTIICALTMAGAALLSDEPEEPIDTDASNHTSIEEGITDLIDAANAGGLTGPAAVLTMGWAGRTASNYLQPGAWRATAVVGTAYPAPGPNLYMWTDIGFDHLRADFNGDRAVSLNDQSQIRAYIIAHDGAADDADGAINNSVSIPMFASGFMLYDLNYDGVINGTDVNDPAFPLVIPVLPGDVDNDGVVALPDIAMIIGSWGQQVDPYMSGDADGDGVVDLADIALVIGHWGETAVPADTAPVGPDAAR